MAYDVERTLRAIKESGAPSVIHNGRIAKDRLRRGVAKLPNYSIDGRTFACDSCKRGHRVSKCTHALQRPVHMTNDPGRPSSDQKRHCDCPKQCSCTKKTCKCERTCNCTQKMYILVYVPYDTDSDQDEDGKWRIDREVITDLKGNQLSDQQIKDREQLKAHLAAELCPVPGNGYNHHGNNGRRKVDKESNSASDSQGQERPLTSCCTHKKAIDASTNVEPASSVVYAPQSETSQSRPQCNCGSACACAFCLDHPNNTRSQDIAKRQAAHFTEQRYFDSTTWFTDLDPSLSSRTSCMGTAPQFAMFDIPNPSSTQLLDTFGPGSDARNGYLLSYPIRVPSMTNPGAPYDLSGNRHGVDLRTTNILDMAQPLSNIGNVALSPIPRSDLEYGQGPSHDNLLDFDGWAIGDASVRTFMGASEDSSISQSQWLESAQVHHPWPTSNNALDSLAISECGFYEGVGMEDYHITSQVLVDDM